MRMCHFPAQNGPFVMNKKILVQPIIISFIYLLVLFIVQNFKKFLLWIQSYEDASFLAQNDPIAQNNFFLKIINIILIYLLPTFIGQNFKKILPADPVMRMCNFWAQNGPFPQMRIFLENLLMSLFLSFMPIYMPQTKVRY